jgi:hypothetical protein
MSSVRSAILLLSSICIPLLANGTNDVSFNEAIDFCNRWLVITKTSTEKIDCDHQNFINTNYFSNLKGGLYICVAFSSLEKKESDAFISRLSKKGDAYLKFSGSYIENRNLIFGDLNKSILFQTFVSDSVVLLCNEIIIPADEAYKEQGIDSTILLIFRSLVKQTQSTISADTLHLLSTPDIKKYTIEKSTVAFKVSSYGLGNTELNIRVWNGKGNMICKEQFFNEGDEESFETADLAATGEKWAIIIKSKSSGAKELTRTKYWNGSKFE